MLLIETRVRPSAIHGMGLFAVNPIPRGTPIWTFRDGFDQTFSEASIAELPSPAQKHLRWFAFQRPEDSLWVLSGDHSCFMNHSATPNTGMPPAESGSVVTVALRDIAAEEELTCDYFAFDSAATAKLSQS